MSVSYATLADARAEIRASTTVDDTDINRLVRAVSRRVDSVFRVRYPIFAPNHLTVQLELNRSRVSSVWNTYALNRPLLALTSVTAYGTAVTPVEAYSQYGGAPFYYLRLTDDNVCWYDNAQADTSPSLSVTGIWGYNRDYAYAYVALDALAGGMTSSATTLTVVDVDGADEYGITPRFSAGAIIRIGDELMDVTATDTATNVLTVRRGVLGTTAAAHDSAASVEVYRVEDTIRHAVARQVGLQYNRRGSYDVLQTDGVTTTQFPADTLATFRTIIGELAYT